MRIRAKGDINLHSAVYTQSANTVILTPKKPFALTKPVQLLPPCRTAAAVSLVLVVPEPSATAEDDLRLPLGQFIQDERARKSGDDLSRDVNSNDLAQSHLILKIGALSAARSRKSDPINVEETRLWRIEFRRDGLEFWLDHHNSSGDGL
jgi:hypothetical protein